ncbi:hypothetical protein SESBI_01741 [Sesbania bispinosa]|nr:hypothetical protein SESBI_01741 [Sesbania bispinosa]
MAHRAVTYDQVRNVSPVADSWVIRVLLSRMWCVHDEFENKDCIDVDMLLIDSDGCKIQAKVYKMLFNNFLSDMLEGSVYRKTVVTRSDPDVLHSVGLSPLTASAIQELQYTDEYLVDMVGLLTGVSTEKEYVSTGVVHRFITLEFTDHTGKVEMAIFDEYVDKFIEYLAKSAHLRPVVVVQLAASGPVNGVLFGDSILRTYLATTKIGFNPNMSEVPEFRRKIALYGLQNAGPLTRLRGQMRYVSIKDDFLRINPKAKIVELGKNEQGRFSIVWAKVVDILDRGTWWVLHCKCGAVLSVINGIFRCDVCNKRVVNPVPKYRLRVQVADGQDTTNFVLLDDEVRYLIRKSCDVLLDEVQLSMNPAADELPQIFNCLVGKTILFKVENYYLFLDGVETYAVRRVCDDIDIISSNLEQQLDTTNESMAAARGSSVGAQSVGSCSVEPGDVVGLACTVECTMGGVRNLLMKNLRNGSGSLMTMLEPVKTCVSLLLISS